MKTNLLFVAALILAGMVQAQNTSFEAEEGYSLGEINGQNGWEVTSLFSNMFTVSDDQASEGQYALRLGIDETGWIPPGSIVGPARDISEEVPDSPDSYKVSADLYFTSTETPQSEIDFYVYGAAGIEAMPGSIMALANGFVRIIELSDLTTAAEVEVSNDVFTNLSVEFDFINQQTLYYVNDDLVYTGDLHLSRVTAYGFLTTGRTVGYVDNIITSEPNLGVDDIEQNQFSHYVNQNKLILKSPLVMNEMVIYNLGGQKILSESLNSTDGNIEIGSLSPGVYIARLNFQDETKSFKFIRE